MRTYDVIFHSSQDSSSKGFKNTAEECKQWIQSNQGSSYFADYKGGIVQVVCNETGEVVYEANIA